MSPNSVPREFELSIVVPVLDEEQAIPAFLEQMRSATAQAGIVDVEYVFVDDGSIDGSWELLARLAAEHDDITAVRLTKNWGKEAALTAGLAQSRGRGHIPMDVDLQDPPEVAVEMYRRWKAGARVVLAKRRRRRGDGLAKRALAGFFYWLIRLGSGTVVPAQVGDFRLMDATVTRRFLALPERIRFNKGLLALVTSANYEVVEFDRPKGRQERARQSWRKLFRLGFDGLVSFTTWPLTAISVLGVVLLFGAILGSILTVILYFTGVLEVPGQATVIMVNLSLFGFQALGLGILGEYTAQILHEVKGRPVYLVEEVRGKHTQEEAR